MRLFFYSLFSFCHIFLSAQEINISGLVTSDENESLFGASVVILSAVDSTLVAFGLTNGEGAFKIKRVSPKKYILQVTYLGYQQINNILDLSEVKNDYDVGEIKMKVTKNKLDEVIIKGEATPIIVTKDTLQYNAAAFQTQPQDVVEDLLRQMPGVEVEDDGTVIAQGEEVKRVTVDGKDFFGKDPKVATKNIAAEAVKSVQFYDRRSDMAEFTGVDDGEREKAMNLQLKPEYRSGYFGNLGVAGGTDKRYSSNLNLNRFGPKSQVSFIGNFNNINQQGFSTDQYMNFMNSMGGVGSRGRSTDIELSRGLSDGFVNTNAGGLNVNYDIAPKTKLNFSYFLNDIENTVDRISSRETFINTESSFYSNQNSQQFSASTGHTFRLMLDHEIDSTQDLRLEANGGVSRANVINEAFSNVLSRGIEQNNSTTDYTYNGANDNVSGRILYRKKLSKTKGRSITLNGSINTLDNETEGYLEAENNFFSRNPNEIIAQEIVQNQIDLNDQTTFVLRSSYIEPLGGGNYLELMYRRSNTDNEVVRDVYDILNGATDINEGLSNYYNRDFNFDRYGMTYHWNGESSSFSVEGMMQHSSLKGELVSDNTTIRNNNTAFLPGLRLRKEFGRGHFMRLNYSTNVREPSLTQIQPIIDNSDPLNIYAGNPDLIPEYRHNMRLNYIKFDQFSFSSLFAFITASYTRNNIINQTIIDDQFARITTPVNVPYDFNTNARVSYSSPIRSLGLKYRTNTNFTYGRNILFINDIENKANRYVARVGLTLENRKKKTLDIQAGFNYNYTLTNYSVDTDRNQSFFNQTYNSSIRYNPSEKWSISSALRVRVFDEQNFGFSRSVPIWTAGLSHNFLAGNRGEVKLAAFDLLNQNLGVNRRNTLNYIENEEIISLGRYFLLSFKYSLRSSGNSNSSPGLRRMRG